MVILFMGPSIYNLSLLLVGTIIEYCVQKAEVLKMACQVGTGPYDF